MEMTVSQMSVSDLRQLISDVVEEKLSEFIDPESHLEFSDEVKAVLARQDVEMSNGERGEPMEDVLARVGLQ